MKKSFVFLILVAAAAVSFAATLAGGAQLTVPISSLKEVESATDQLFAGDPWEMLGFTRGTYLPGYGVLFTFEMSLVHVTPVTPFNPVFTAQQKKTFHDRKMQQLPVLEGIMRNSVVKAASSLQTLPGSENIVFEAHLLSQSYEDHSGLPWRVSMTANRQAILDAVARHAGPAEISSLIEERKE